MGLFSFLKKKEVVPQPSQPQFDISQLSTDLPPLDGSAMPYPANMPPYSDNSQPTPPNEMPTTPDFNANIPPLDYSMPPDINPFDQQPQMQQQSMQQPQQPPQQNMLFNNQYNNQFNNQSAEQPTGFADTLNTPAIEENLNKLFMTDEAWKEPDWKNFQPYVEDTIEEPKVEDFGMPITPMQMPPAQQPEHQTVSDLPAFDDEAQENAVEDADMPETIKEAPKVVRPDLYSLEVPKKKITNYAPMDLFVRGSDYKAVVEEMKKINSMLGAPEPEIDITEDLIRKQELDLNGAKENMEFVYKKLVAVDKRIFS